jgi:hypothetical protein
MFPSRTFSGVMGLSGDDMDAGSGPKTALALFMRSSSGPAVDSGTVNKRTLLMATMADTIFNAVREMMTFEQFMMDLLVQWDERMYRYYYHSLLESY